MARAHASLDTAIEQRRVAQSEAALLDGSMRAAAELAASRARRAWLRLMARMPTR